MLSKASLSILAVAALSSVSAEVLLWNQCGGQGYTGDTRCVAGAVCVREDQYFSYCEEASSVGGNLGGSSGGLSSGSVKIWDQCGGRGYTGPTRCESGLTCEYYDDEWYFCSPGDDDSSSDVAELWGQCGGDDYTGPTKCPSGSRCVVDNQWWSSCEPTTVVPTWEQCGGEGYDGPTECEAGSRCVYDNEWWSACLVSCTKPEYECEQEGSTCVIIDQDANFGMCQVVEGGQCGGEDFVGWTKCVAGTSCVEYDSWYSECVSDFPRPSNSGCSQLYGQCGGSGFTGPKCCESGSVCKYSNSYYSQCLKP